MPELSSRGGETPEAALSAEDWLSLLEVVAEGGVRLLVSTHTGGRVVFLAEQDLVELHEAAARRDVAPVLTPRERQVLALVEQGLSAAHIAEHLGVAPRTVVQHLAAARRKYGVPTSAQAAVRARAAGDLG